MLRGWTPAEVGNLDAAYASRQRAITIVRLAFWTSLVALGYMLGLLSN